MTYDFDTQLALRGRRVSKYDNIGRSFGSDDPGIIPMWVADMDFAAAPPIRAAMQAEVDLGYFGYYGNPRPVSEAVAEWYRDRHGWPVEPGAVRFTHGVVNGFGNVLATFSEPGDKVIVFSPVYHAFFRQAQAMGREVMESPLKINDGRFEMDLDGLQGQLTGRERILTMCSPHNPGGRLWEADELRAVAAFCAKNSLILISDEIHMDLVFPGATFMPTAVAAPDHLDRLMVLTAASKGFNMAGFETGLLIVPDATLAGEGGQSADGPGRHAQQVRHGGHRSGVSRGWRLVGGGSCLSGREFPHFCGKDHSSSRCQRDGHAGDLSCVGRLFVPWHR